MATGGQNYQAIPGQSHCKYHRCTPASGITLSDDINSYRIPRLPIAAYYIGQPQGNLFDTKAIRNAFVSKVYSILIVQLIFSSALIALFTIHTPTKQYFQANGEFYLYGALAMGMIVYFILICVESARRSTPWNYVLLFLLTVAYGLIAAILSSRFNTLTVLAAFGATAAATLIVYLLAKYSSFDMTTCGCGLCVLALLHLLLSILLIVILVPLGYAKAGSLIIAGLGAFLVSLYMMFDLQLIMGGRSAELSPEEYILGAVLLYIDIINLFQYMLILMAGRE